MIVWICLMLCLACGMPWLAGFVAGLWQARYRIQSAWQPPVSVQEQETQNGALRELTAQITALPVWDAEADSMSRRFCMGVIRRVYHRHYRQLFPASDWPAVVKEAMRVQDFDWIPDPAIRVACIQAWTQRRRGTV